MDARKRLRELYRTLYFVRRAEELVAEHYGENGMKTPVHLSIGQEATAVGVLAALRDSDLVFGTYRSHALYLARSGDSDGFFAELYGRATGSAGGKAGSMHLAAPARGLLATSAVVGSTIPLALGAAFAARYRGQAARVAVFFGDGATDEGVFWESLNMACLKRLPILFVCEDNGLAIHSRHADRRGYVSLAGIVERFACDVYRSDSTDASEIAALAEQALRVQEREQRPAFLELECYRYTEHVGPRIDRDFELPHRDAAEFERWWRRDPLLRLRERLLTAGAAAEELQACEHDCDEKLLASLERARAAALPAAERLLEHVFA
jgi:TPP-dependent pyruvate/acetoin dehydrogenase alpha subunit